MEVVTAYWNDTYAKDLHSFATPDEPHVSIGNGPFMNMDEEFASKFVSVVRSKLEKKGYISFRDEYGPGYLVVSIHYPFLSSDSMELIEQKWAQAMVNNLGCFRSVYITFREFEGYRVLRWKVMP